MSARLQKWIYFLEEGKGARALRISVATLAFVALALLYNIGSFKNFYTEEAMDASQLARNISEGQGYTTKYVRPISLALVGARANEKFADLQKKLGGGKLSEEKQAELEKEQTQLKNLAFLKTTHPDLANAPVYPTLLAGFMKIAPIDCKISKKKSFLTYAPELWIAALNQILFFFAAVVLFLIARQLFDRAVAWISALLFVATELFWRLSISGLSTLLLLLIFLVLTWALLQLDCAIREKSGKQIFWTILAGILVGLGCMTRYSFGWLILPVLIFISLLENASRRKLYLTAIVTFLLMISPWLIRNYSLSGNLFGTAGYAICQNTPAFQETRLERSMDSDSIFSKVFFADYLRKFMVNTRNIFENELLRLGGSWLTAFFMVGLLIPLERKEQSQLRVFLLFSFGVLLCAQALGQTHLSADSPQINSENLLILTAPLVIAFGVALYFDLHRRVTFSEPFLPYAITLFFCGIISLPLVFTVLPPGTNPIGYPPYYPPIIQETSRWMRKNELMMSDVPWAVAWYGNRQCVPLSQTYPNEFFRMNDDVKTVQALYLTPKTMDGRFLSQMVKDRQSWGRFVLESLSKGEVPDGFPLKKSPAGFLPDQFFLTDWERWTTGAE